jgi:hypothetical protein
MRWVGTEVRNHPTFDSTSYLNKFLIDIDGKVVPNQRISVFDIALKDTLAKWRATHRALLRIGRMKREPFDVYSLVATN